MIGSIFSIACALYVRNVLKLTRDATSSCHIAHTPCATACVCVCVWRRLIKLIEFDCHLSCAASVANLANVVHLQHCNTVAYFIGECKSN